VPVISTAFTLVGRRILVRNNVKRQTYLLLPLLVAGVATLITACKSAASPTPAASRTGIPYVDKVIDAGLSGDPQVLNSLIHLSLLPCTIREGLGGPPKCLPGEPDGTVVEAFPVLSSEGGHVRKPEIDTWAGLGQAKLYAVYRTTRSTTYSDEFYPAGEFAVVFFLKDPDGFVTLQVTRDGIVRFDSGFGKTVDEIYQEHKEDFILGPFSPAQ
jgi:hypothetical protein